MIWIKTDLAVSIAATVLIFLALPLTVHSMVTMWQQLSRQGTDHMLHTETQTGTLSLRADGHTREVAEFYVGDSGTQGLRRKEPPPAGNGFHERTALLGANHDAPGFPCIDRGK